MIARYDLSKGREPQKFGLGMKEIWEVRPREVHKAPAGHPHDGLAARQQCRRRVVLYHADNQVFVGFVVHLNYENPYLYPPIWSSSASSTTAGRRVLRAASAHRLRRARHLRGRLAVDPQSSSFPGGAWSAARPDW